MASRWVRTFAVGALTLQALALASGTHAAAADERAFTVGVLRRDAILLPFGYFDGKRWSAPWPPPAIDLTVPIDLRSVPKRWWGGGEPLARWQVAVAGGARSVTVVQPDWVSMPCTRYIGLRTDYQPATPAPPERVQPYPKDGLAVSPPYAVDRIDILAAESPELRALAPAVRAAFNEAERTIEDRFGHPIARRSREGLAPDLEAVYAYGDNPRTYYVEATRTYRQLGQRAGDCTAVGSGTGWFARDADGIRSLTMVVDLLNCDRRSASYMLPLGVLRTDGHLYWLGQFSGWDHERYVVLELKKKSVDLVLNRWASGC